MMSTVTYTYLNLKTQCRDSIPGVLVLHQSETRMALCHCRVFVSVGTWSHRAVTYRIN